MKLDSSTLYQTCAPVDFANPTQNLRLAQHLIQLMMKENGIGLAANQAGINARLFVMYVDREIFHCFNPEIIDHSQDTETIDEGCLSFPGQLCSVQRWVKITARYANARGQLCQREFTGLAARCFQHEYDHLNGVTMFDKQAVVSINV
jgi:peptide deformylase